MDQLRKIIQETLSSVIEEDFASVNEIKEISNQVLVLAAEKNFNYIVRQIKEGTQKLHIYPVKLIDIYQNSPEKYPTLQDFVVDSNVVILFSFVKDSNTLGHYKWTDEEEYDKTRTRFVTLFYDDKLVDDIREKIEDREKNRRTLEKHDIYFSFWYKFHSTLEHEIQHAYDDYRSKSKIFRAKRFDKYRKKYHKKSGEETVVNDPKMLTKKHLDYLKLQHEIEARFTQAISNTRFTNADFSKSTDGVDYVSYTMKPLSDVLKKFPYEFSGWNLMSEKTKKNLIRRVSQYWHKIQEDLPNKNKRSLDKEIEALKKKEALAEFYNVVNQIKNAIQNKR